MRQHQEQAVASVSGLAGAIGGYEQAARSFQPGVYQPGGNAWFAEPEVADVEPLDETADEPARTTRFKTWHIGPLAVGAAVLLIALVLLFRTNNYDDRPNTVQTRERYAPGACVNLSPAGNGEQQATEVPCSQPHSGKVRAKVEFPRPCPLQTQNVVISSEQISLCLDP